MTELLPCAHCGGKATLLHGHFLADNTPYVICDDCEIQTAYCDTEAEAEAVWNRRAYQWIDEGEEFHSDPGEYGRNPVTAEDVLRAAAQMRAEVEALEAKHRKGVMTVEEYRRVIDNPPWLLRMRAKTVENPPLDTEEGS